MLLMWIANSPFSSITERAISYRTQRLNQVDVPIRTQTVELNLTPFLIRVLRPSSVLMSRLSHMLRSLNCLPPVHLRRAELAVLPHSAAAIASLVEDGVEA